MLLVATAALTAGCSIKFTSNKEQAGALDGGIWRSNNKGVTWLQKTLVPTVSGRPASFGAFNVFTMTLDPSDRRAVYIGTVGEGLLYSYDGAESWQRANALGKVVIRAVAIDPGDKCVIYAAVDNKLNKSIDCNRSWSEIYVDNDRNVKINTVAIDYKDPRIVFIGTSRGEIIKSFDAGEHWQTINRFGSKVMKIMISPHDNKLMFAATERNNLQRSKDGGNSWESLGENLKDHRDSVNFKDLVFYAAEPGKLFLASNVGLLKSIDNGDTWDEIKLITPDNKTVVNAVAVSPKDDKELYYATNTTFYSTVDGGASWKTRKLPTTRAGWILLVDPEDTNLIYMGVRSL